MATKKKRSTGRTLLSLLLILPSLLNLFKNLALLFKGEAKKIGKRFILLMILSSIVAGLLISSWICLLGFFFIYLTTSFHWTPSFSLLIILAINILLLLLISFIISRVKKHLFSSFRQKNK